MLGVLWLLDAALQYQPFMFRRAFAEDVIRPAGEGQPSWVSGPVRWSADLIAGHPVPLNTAFATVQLLLGLGLLWRRTARAALVGSVVWSVGVWWLGEGLGGLAGGHATLITGAPGAVALYAVLAVLAWPGSAAEREDDPPSDAAVLAWSAVWLLGTLLQLLPGQNSGQDVSGALDDAASAAPAWLATPGHHLAAWTTQHPAGYLVLVLAMPTIALLALRAGAPRIVSVTGGCLLALAFWAFGQTFGELLSGQSTDPNTGPLLILLGITVASVPDRRTEATIRPARHARQQAHRRARSSPSGER